MSKSSPGMEDALRPAADGLLADVASWVEGDELSAFSLVPRADDALKARLALIDSAVSSLDIKYFIWKGDESSRLVFARLMEAAARGVRVRILIDDLNLDASDEELAQLDAHPNVAICIFNPTENRSTIGALLDYAGAFDDMNKRMHNKMVLADGHVGLLGGRNIANEYFGLTNKYNFLDLDVIVAGPVVAEVGIAFDEYWNTDLAVPAPDPENPVDPIDLDAFVERERAFTDEHLELLAHFSIDRRDWREWFGRLAQRWHLGTATYIHDEPVGAGRESGRLLEFVDIMSGTTESELDLVSAYLLPDQALLDGIAQEVAKGVRVRVVTGTQESINHTPVYAHYRKDIGDILDTGAELYEIDGQPSPEVRRAADTPPAAGKFVAIHLKGMVRDRREAFLGSLNLDPRAMDINTEGGLLIQSEGLGAELGAMVDTLTTPANAWRVSRDEADDPVWRGKGEVLSRSPDRGPIQEGLARLFSVLPIRDQL